MKFVNVRVKYGGQILAYDCGDLAPALGDWVVARENDLVYLGQVVTAPTLWPAGMPAPYKKSEARTRRGPKRTENRRLVRLATPADLALQAESEIREREAFDYCQTRVEAQGLEMRLLAVEAAFDGSKTIFYYTADERVDFRLLVKELVSRFRTRIEMRQIGVRHKARLLGGLGGCGRDLCCCGFLANFAPVSVKMAKEQGLSLSPAKISGICGRLLCCLAFEHQGPPAGRPGESEAEAEAEPGFEDEPVKDHASGPGA
jgi:cell fate regulator YaaT (PSP1 superfamily)